MNDRSTIDDELARLGEPPCLDEELEAEAPAVLEVEALFASAVPVDAARVATEAADSLDDLARRRVWRTIEQRTGKRRMPARMLVIGTLLATAAAVLIAVVGPREFGASDRRDETLGMRAEAEQLRDVATQALAAFGEPQGAESQRADELARRYAARLHKEAG